MQTLLFLSTLAVVLGVGYVAGDLSSAATARSLAAHGTWVQARDVRVHVTYHGRDDYYAVDAVAATLPGVQHRVALALVNGPDIGGDPAEGWQHPTPRTGYDEPLTVREMVDARGSVIAVAQRDLSAWTTKDFHLRQDLELACAGLVVAALTLLGHGAWARRRVT